MVQQNFYEFQKSQSHYQISSEVKEAGKVQTF